MPNRIIKESICTSENIDALSAFEETFFIRLIVNCDDYGRMDARPKLLASKLYPLRDIKPYQMENCLATLHEKGLITLYTVGDHEYLQMKTWEKHQQIRAHKSKYPSPDEGICKQMISDDIKCPRNPIQSNTNPIQSESESNGTSANECAKLFDQFWKAYPRKESKPTAKKAFEKIKPDEELLQKMLAAIERFKKTDQWQEDGGRFIPHPSTWLNQRRWEDEPMAAKQTTGKGQRILPAQNFAQRDYTGVTEEMIKKQNDEIIQRYKDLGIWDEENGCVDPVKETAYELQKTKDEMEKAKAEEASRKAKTEEEERLKREAKAKAEAYKVCANCIEAKDCAKKRFYENTTGCTSFRGLY